MMWLALQLCSAPALAVDEPVDVEALPVRTSIPVRQPRKIRFAGPPVRFEVRTGFRDGVAPNPIVEAGVQVVRLGRFTVDGALGYNSHASVVTNGLFRTMGSVNGSVDGLYEIGNWLGVGPTAGLSFRIFRQQFTDIDAALIPVVGLRTHVGLIRARRWSFGLSGKVTADLVRTDLVLDTTAITTVSPFEVQLGGRIQLGHGRDRRKRREGPA
ncbi:MAG: hypothetical protein H6737_12160 [Alphaproteobacteria bacterium]|nr:hypothetical protein [Alphaproteobacteria bacterium]